jgi:hypothetical protein
MRLFRRIMVMTIFVSLLLALRLPAFAVQTGSIRIETTGGTVALYQVGEINGQAVRLFDAYGGGIVGEDDILSANLAAWLNERAQNGHIKDTDLWGDTLFDGLPAGLYLVAQPSTPSGQKPFAPFLIMMPWDGYMWEITVDMEELPQTGGEAIPAMWIGGMAFSAIGIGICMLWRKKIIV